MSVKYTLYISKQDIKCFGNQNVIADITFSFTTGTQQLSTSLNIWAVPIKAVFCACSIFSVIPISFTNFSNLIDTAPSAPTTTGMTDTFRMSQSLAISSFKGPYFSIFSSSFSGTLTSLGIATSVIFTSFCTLSVITTLAFELLFPYHTVLHNPTRFLCYYFQLLLSVSVHTILLLNQYYIFTKFPMYIFPYIVVASFILFLSQLATFTDNM